MSIPDFSPIVQRELNDVMFAEKLGSGQYRDVYVSRIDSRMVIKYERLARQFNNAQEWMIWQEVQGTDLARWFAPCFLISSCGSFLIQARTKPIERLPAALPDFFADVKPANFGRYKGRIVCHDYGNNRIYAKGLHRWCLRPITSF